MTDIKAVYKKIEEEFFKKLEEKTSWGRNDLKEMYMKTKADVLEAELKQEGKQS